MTEINAQLQLDWLANFDSNESDTPFAQHIDRDNNSLLTPQLSAELHQAASRMPTPAPETGSSHLATQEDLNPRSPKRRKLNVPEDGAEDDDEDVLDIGAAAARALAISLGQTPLGSDAITSPAIHQNDGSHIPSTLHVLSQHPPLPPPIPTRQLRVDSLPQLLDTAVHILTFLAKMNHLEIGEMLFGPPTARGTEYRALRQKFDAEKGIYLLNGSPFLSPQALDLAEISFLESIRKINIAVFMSSIFSGEIGLRIMDMNFVDVFVPEGGRLLKAQGAIYLELKTHAFMAATRTAVAMLNQVMLDLFPGDMDRYFLAKRPGAKGLAPSEQDFLNRLASRRDILYSVIRTNTLGTLPDTYRWNDFAREVSIYLTKYVENSAPNGKENTENQSPPSSSSVLQRGHLEGQFPLNSSSAIYPTTSLPAAVMTATTTDFDTGDSGDLDLSLDSIEEFVAQAARAAALSMGDSMDLGLLPTPLVTTSTLTAGTAGGEDRIQSSPPNQRAQLSLHDGVEQTDVNTQFRHYHPVGDASTVEDADTESEVVDGEVPHSSQTAPTQVLYERARQVTTNKALISKKLVPPSHRRPWTTEEENALMTGLDQVKGPHWSQILAMYGPGGTIDESLKDRNQVQLKDKARNLKLFFLKAGIEVPYYLQAVTGDLRTRAPGQAEKKERERLLEEGERQQQDDATASADVAEPGLADSEPREGQGATLNPYQAVGKQAHDTTDDATNDDDDDAEFDMEAMIARAAASASQSLSGPPWGS